MIYIYIYIRPPGYPQNITNISSPMVISHPTFVAQGPQPPPGPQPRAVPRHHRLCEKLRAWWEADKPTVGLAVNCGYYMVITMTYHGYYIIIMVIIMLLAERKNNCY